jgi:hypothetical protein
LKILDKLLKEDVEEMPDDLVEKVKMREGEK